MGIYLIFILPLVISVAVIIWQLICDKRFHFLFPLQFAFALITLSVSIHWLIAGEAVLINCSAFWEIVERGSLESLSSVMSIVGIGSILLGWVYSDRDKITLGKRQIDMIQYQYGYSYACSLITHFGATALCILMAKCFAKEAALWAFITVAWGCIPQSLICLQIALNRGTREDLALKLWKKDAKVCDSRVVVIFEMTEYLSEASVRYSKKFRDGLSSMIKDWLIDCCQPSSAYITAESIKSTSAIFEKVSEKVPQKEQAGFFNEMQRKICNELSQSEDTINICALTLLSCSYLRFLYASSDEKARHHTSKAMYYSQNDNKQYEIFLCQIQDLLYGIEWFLFLSQRSGLPNGKPSKKGNNAYMKEAFGQMINSVYPEETETIEKLIDVAWNQVYPEVINNDGTSTDIPTAFCTQGK